MSLGFIGIALGGWFYGRVASMASGLLKRVHDAGRACDLQHRRDGVVFRHAFDPGVDPRELRRAGVGRPVATLHQVETRECGVKVFVLTDSPSPYQVELFNEIEAQGNCELKVGYLRSRDPQRQWTSSEIRHESIESGREWNVAARESAARADLVVFNYYFHPHANGADWRACCAWWSMVFLGRASGVSATRVGAGWTAVAKMEAGETARCVRADLGNREVCGR